MLEILEIALRPVMALFVATFANHRVRPNLNPQPGAIRRSRTQMRLSMTSFSQEECKRESMGLSKEEENVCVIEGPEVSAGKRP